MATFTEIYKQELKNKGVLSSLGSSILKQTKEKIDPRNILFGGQGALSLTGQKLFGKGYQAVSPAKKISETESLKSDVLTDLLVSSKKQEAQLSIIAKNTMSTRAMARDINVMRQNIIKLVKKLGGETTNKADIFFRKQAEEESAYENQFQKQLSTSTKPTPIKKIENPEKKGLLSGLMDVGSVIVSSITSAVMKIPQLLMSGLKQAFSNLPTLLSAGVAGTKFTMKALWGALKFAGTRLLLPLITSPIGLAILGAAGIAWIVKKMLEDEPPVEENAPRDETTGQLTDAGRIQARVNKLMGEYTAGKLAKGVGPNILSGSEEHLKILENRGGDDAATAQEFRKLMFKKASDTVDFPLPPSLPPEQEDYGRSSEDLRPSLQGTGFTQPEPVKAGDTSSFERGRPNPNGPTKLLGFMDEEKKQLLDFIGQKESNGDYNALVYGKNTPKRASLVGMTVQQVLDYQKGMIERGHASTAVGKYQITRATLEEFAKKAGVSLNTKFDSEAQDRIAAKILDEVGFEDYRSGRINLEDFQQKIAKRWASMPVASGKSYYEGLNGNRALVSNDAFQNMMRNLKPSNEKGSTISASSAETASLSREAMVPQQPNVVVNAPQTSVSNPAPVTQPVASVYNMDAMELFINKAVDIG